MSMMIEMPDELIRAIDGYGAEIKKKVQRGDFVIVYWGDAADERQVVYIKPHKVPTPVETPGFFYDVIANHVVLLGSIYTEVGKSPEKYVKDATYIPVAWIQGIEVRSDGQRRRLIRPKTWGGHAHTRKVRIGRRTRAIHARRVREALGEEEWRRHRKEMREWWADFFIKIVGGEKP